MGVGTGRAIIDGNEAAASVAYRLNELCSICLLYTSRCV